MSSITDEHDFLERIQASFHLILKMAYKRAKRLSSKDSRSSREPDPQEVEEEEKEAPKPVPPSTQQSKQDENCGVQRIVRICLIRSLFTFFF